MKQEVCNAILIDPRDSVATVTVPVRSGETVCWAAGGAAACLTALEDIPRYHKVAVKPVPAGDAVLKYGEYVGRASRDIPAGAWVHVHNLG